MAPAHAQEPLEAAAKAAIAAHDFSQARALYLRLLAQQPENIDYLQWAARLSAWIHDYPAAIGYYDRAIALAPRDADPLIGKALVMTWQGQLPQAHELLAQAAQISPPGNPDLAQAQRAYRRQFEVAHRAPLLAQARAAVAAHQWVRARQLYGALYRETPEQLGYLVWMARLDSWLGHYDTAIEEYEEALARAPRDIDILVGEANVSMWQGHYDRTRDLLTRAQAIDLASQEVKLGWATYYHIQDLDAKAFPYVDQVLARQPNNQDARLLRSELVMPHPWVWIVGYEHDWFNFVTPGNVYSTSVGYDGSSTRILLQYECWDRFHVIDHRGGFSLSEKLAPRTWLHGQGFWSPGASIIPREDYSVGISQGLPWGVALNADYRYLHFSGIDVHIFSPSFEYYFTRPIWLHFAFYETLTDIQGLPQDEARSYLAQYNQQVGPWTVHLGYAYGNESFSQYTIDRVGQFTASTVFTSLDYAASEQLKLSAFYSFQTRSDDQLLNSIGLAVIFRR